MCPGVALQVERVVEALSAEGAEIPLGVAVALHVAVQQSLQSELLGARSALELGRVRIGPHRGQLLLCLDEGPVGRHWVLESVAAVDQLDGHVGRDAEPLRDDLDPHLKRGDVADVVLVRGGGRLLPRR